MKRLKKAVSVLLSLVLVITSFSFHSTKIVAETNDTLTETSLLSGQVTSSSDATRGTGDAYDGFIITCHDTSVDYLKITYTIDDASNLLPWTWLFNFQPYTSSWAGWECNPITLSDSTYEDGEYTAYISVDKIKESCTEGDVAGINLCYCEVAGTTLQLTGCYAVSGSMSGNTGEEEQEEEGKKYVPSSASNDYVNALGDGWNLGNTFDSYDTNLNVPDLRENTWGNPDVTKELLHAIKEKGFESIRIPMTTYRRCEKKNGKYVIDETWLARYKEVVDWAVDEGFYVMINMHHDSSWLSQWDGNKSSEEYIRFTDSWKQIADYFKDEPAQVCFETINEPQFYKATKDCTTYNMLDMINLAAYNIIRQSGGNNQDRMIVMPTYNTNQEADSLTDLYNLITGLQDDNIIATIHYYSEWCFSGNLGTTGFDDPVNGGDTTSRDAIKTTFQKVYDQFIANGIGIVVGEYGLLGTNEVGEYVKYLEEVIARGHEYGMSMIFWDAGNYINRRDTVNYSWNEPRLGEMIDAGMHGRSSTADCLDELYFSGTVNSDVKIPLRINGPEFTGIKGLTEGVDYTYDADSAVISLKASYVNKGYASLGSTEYGVFDELLIQFTSGANWHEYLCKYSTALAGTAAGSTNGITVPVTYNGAKVRRVSAYQRSGAVGPTHTWCKYLTFAGDFTPDYAGGKLTLNSSFLGDASLKDGPVLVNVEMWDGQILRVWLNKEGSAFQCGSQFAEDIEAEILSPEQIVIYTGETSIPAQYLNLPEGGEVYGTWITDSSVIKMDGWPATMTFSKTPTAFTIGGIVVYYYDNMKYVNAQFAVKAMPVVSDIIVDSGQTEKIQISNLTEDAIVKYHMENDAVASVSDNGIVTGLGAGSTVLTVTVSQYGRTDTFTAKVTVTGEPVVTPTVTPTATELPTVTPTVTPTATELPTVTPTTVPTHKPVVKVNSNISSQISQTYTISSGTLDNLDLSKLTIRFCYDKGNTKEQNFWVDNAGIGYNCDPYYVNYTSSVKYTITDSYVEISFSKPLQLGNGVLTLQTRMNNADWSAYTDFKATDTLVFYDGNLINA